MEPIHEMMSVSQVFIDDGRAPVAQMAQRDSTPSKTKQNQALATPGDLQAAFRDFLAALGPEDRAIVQKDLHTRGRERTIQSILDSPEERTRARQLFDF